MNPSSNPDPNLCTCSPLTCEFNCALQVVDRLLQAAGSVRGEEMDALLDLRWLLHRHQDAEEAVRLFCRLRRMMEHRHYLAFYRLRRWLENHVEVQIEVPGTGASRVVLLQLQPRSWEAVRHQLLQSALPRGRIRRGCHIRFGFRAVQPVAGGAGQGS
jgi:hypothetical protein